MIARRAVTLLLIFTFWPLSALPVWAQAPVGIISGVVTDFAGARVPGARVAMTNRDTGLTRVITTSNEGGFSAAVLPSGVYQLRVEAEGFRPLISATSVEAGTTTTVTLSLQIGDVTEQVTVDEAAPLLHYEQHQVGGVVTREQIENLPLNGRNFLELAKLEPGVTNPVPSTNNRILVPVLGTGLQNRVGFARVTVDGANINLIATVGAALQISQEDVQEFQISTINFDLSTGLTTSGAINIVTRSGGNSFHGTGFYFYRDHNIAAYPGLSRDFHAEDPFFQRQQLGFQLGGPIRQGRSFFFTSYERKDQRGVFSIQPRTPEFVPLGAVFPSPYLGNQFDLRLDIRSNSTNSIFVRYTHDGNKAFAPLDGRNSTLLLPSAWSKLTNWVDQSIVGLTSVVSSRLVNDLRFSYFFISSPETPASAENCRGCLGLDAPRMNIPDAAMVVGRARTLSFVGRRYQLTENLTWQRNNHRLSFGLDWEHSSYTGQTLDQDPATIALYSPGQVRTFNATAPAAAQITLPVSFLTMDDLLRLPLRTFSTGVGPGVVPHRDFRKYRRMDLYRLYSADSWRIGSRLTVNYGLAWSFEPNSLNTDLTKPTLLTAILGPEGLDPPVAQKGNFSPVIGFAWAATSDGKTVIRGGAGRYFDPVSHNSGNIVNERLALAPAGTGRKIVPGSSISFEDRPIEFTQGPTHFTALALLNILPGIRAQLQRQLNAENRDFTFRNLNLNKTGANLSDPHYATQYSVHLSAGVQRELTRDLVLSADFVYRRFLHTYFAGVDYNRFKSAKGPVIPQCSPVQRNDITSVCSAGPITFDNTAGVAQYKGLLMRLEKRFSGRTQFLASYAIGSYKGTNGPGNDDFPATGFNNDNWLESYGPLPTDLRHILNLSGLVELPRRFQISFSVSAYSRPPFSVYVSGIDFNGDGTQNDLLPGTGVNQFNRGLDQEDLAGLVKRYNEEVALRLTASGQIAPRIKLPNNYAFNDSFFTQDLRLSRTFSFGGERWRLALLAEVFNLFNTANLVQFSGNIANTTTFGQPDARSAQVFGSGGPRAFQFGARLSF